MRVPARLSNYLNFVRFEHTVFALPLILASAILAEERVPGAGVLALIVVAAAGARTCAMALNRLIDAKIDALNPRTANRELPAGKMGLREAWGLLLAASAVYLTAAAALGRTCLYLSPIPLAVFALYPYMKRITVLSHFGVGAADAMGPLGAWVAVRCAAGRPILDEPAPLIYFSLFAFLWISGFDIIYATQDEDFDRSFGLHSLPARLGRDDALKISGLLHFLAAACLGFIYMLEFAGPFPLLVLAAIILMLVLEHARIDDIRFAFFTANAAIGALTLAFIAAGLFVREY